ncbi:MAG: radical SAM protein [Planctomycetota bacterium JB042]
MRTAFDPSGPLHAPFFLLDEEGPVSVLIDPERVRWIGTNRAGRALLERVRAEPGVLGGRLVAPDDRAGRRFLKDAHRRGFLSGAPFPAVERRNRRESMAPSRLHEFWVVTNDHCNLRCRHCYTIDRVVEGRTGLSGETLRAIMAEAHALGTEIFYFTGGEPTLRDDFLDLARFVLERARLILFTNGLTIDDALAAALAPHRDRLIVQVSIEGPDEETSRPVRGKGSFAKALDGVRVALRHGLRVGVSTTPNGVSKERVHELTAALAAMEEGGNRPDYHHLILLLDRGGAERHDDIRALDDGDLDSVLDRSAAAIRRAKATLKGAAPVLTNDKIFHALATHGPAKDYCGAGYTILGVSADGRLLPCAAAMDDDRFFLGDLVEEDGSYRAGRLEALWREADSVERIRRFSLAPTAGEPVRDLRYFHGGGCWKNMPDPGSDFATGHPFAGFYERRMRAAIREAAHKGVREVTEGAPRLHTFLHPARIACAGARKTEAIGDASVDQGYCICFA